MISLQELAAQALSRDAEYHTVEFEKRWYNWEEFRQVADCVKKLLDDSGADPLSIVAFLPRNRPAVLAALIELLRRGQSIRMMHVYQAPAGIAGDISGLKPSAVIGDTQDFSDEVCAVLREQGIAGIALSNLQAAAVEGCEASTVECDGNPPIPQIELLTSGTTGAPKQFPLSFDLIAKDMVGVNVMNTAQAIDPLHVPPLYVYLTSSTISGLYLIVPSLLSGVRGFLVDRFTVASWHDYVTRYQPTTVGLPLPAIQMIMDAKLAPEDLSSIKAITTGAALLHPEIHRAFEARYGIPLLFVYGATEFGGPVAMMTADLYRRWGEKKFGSLGRAWAGAMLRVVDPETGDLLAAGEEGLLEVQTPRIGPDWIRTSDLCVIDEDEFVFFRGRADGAINRGGFKIIPESVETALRQHEAVAEASLVGLPDKRLGEVPVAAVQFKFNAQAASTDELEQHLREHVPVTPVPVAWRIVDAMPYVPTMKIDRRAVRRLFEE